MNETLTTHEMTAEQDRRISQAVAREGSRLRTFIRRRVADASDAEDILQEVLYELGVLLEELEAALDELPDEQREVFIAHQLEGRSFKELAAETGVSINTLLSRKHYAVLHLRRRLRDIYNQFND